MLIKFFVFEYCTLYYTIYPEKHSHIYSIAPSNEVLASNIVQDLTKKNKGGESMTLISCKRSPAISPYLVVATSMVKDCPIHATTELENCRNCENYNGERE